MRKTIEQSKSEQNGPTFLSTDQTNRRFQCITTDQPTTLPPLASIRTALPVTHLALNRAPRERGVTSQSGVGGGGGAAGAARWEEGGNAGGGGGAGGGG